MNFINMYFDDFENTSIGLKIVAIEHNY